MTPTLPAIGSLALLLLLGAGCNRPAEPMDATIVISDVAVVDVEHGTLLEHQDVVIDGHRITAMAETGTIRVSESWAI